MTTINCKGKLINLNTPKVMGIINATPDSFYKGSRSKTIDSALQNVEKMLVDGADFIDIGGYSTRPGAQDISIEEEIDRVCPLIESFVKFHPEINISIDTFRAQVAEEAVKSGAVIINDISGGTLDKNMFATVGKLNVPYILMHIKGTPKNMQDKPTYNNIFKEVSLYFSEKLAELKSLGVNDIILDLGFGFGKTVDHNFDLLQKLEGFKAFGFPTLTGVSRKSMIYKTLNTTADQALNGTSVINTIALLNGTNILRVHDVKEAKECITLVNQIK